MTRVDVMELIANITHFSMFNIGMTRVDVMELIANITHFSMFNIIYS